MNSNIGDFIISKYSKTPSLIINKTQDTFFVALTEYNGDYKYIEKEEATKINLNPSQELSILSNFGHWFYKSHPTIYQEIIIKNLNNYFL
jgi:hypothetical protein